MLPRIFLGGTGLSGTTILRQAIGYHKDIYALPREMRFLVDPDGLINLLDALTVNYSQDQAREALYRFERLMRVYLATPQRPYLNYDIASYLGGEYYWQRLDYFCSALIEVEFSGMAIMLEPPTNEGTLVDQAKSLRKRVRQIKGHQDAPQRLTLPRPTLRIPKYFSDRSNLVALTANFVEDLFCQATCEQGKQTWCEKTPQNILHFNFLSELFPESLLIHIKRDPRGVANSLTKHHWGPDDIRGACLFLRSTYERWFDAKETIDKNRFFELKLEELALSPQAILERIALFCGVENSFQQIPDMDPARINSWQKNLSHQDIQVVNNILGPYIERLGYKI